MSIRVLLIDHHDHARTTLAKRLHRDARLDLVAAASLAEAADLLPNARPDIVLLDIHGHDGRGVDACRTLRQLTDAPVVVFTSFMTPTLWAAASAGGAADYLLKHVDTDRLSREILRLANRHRVRSPANRL